MGKKGNASVHKTLAQLRFHGLGGSRKGGRSCNADMFAGSCANGEKIERKWPCYSPTSRSLHCLNCRLFGTTSSALASTAGFSDWKHAYERLSSHEHSHGHMCAVTEFAKIALVMQWYNVSC